MPHGRGPPLARLVVGALGLGDALGKDLSVLALPDVSTCIEWCIMLANVRQHPWKPQRGGA